MAILSVSHLMEVLGTVIIIKHLTGTGKQRLHVFPNPLRPIADDAKPYRLLGQQAGVFDLLQGFAKLVFTLHLMPTEQMHDAIAVEQVEPKPFGLVPLVSPPRPSGPVAGIAWAAPPSTLGTRRHISAINAQHQHRTAKAS